MRVGRNQPCICGSEKKFKNCCMRLFVESSIRTVLAPFLQVPLTVHAMVRVDSMHENDTPPFWPICVIGKQWSDIQFSGSGTEIQGSQLVRLGFINREFRPIAQIRTNSGSFESVSGIVLRPGIFQVVATFTQDKLSLFVDGRKVASSSMSGYFTFSPYESVAFGHGGGGGIAYVSILRRALTDTEVNSLWPFSPPQSVQDWSVDKFGISRTFTLGEFGDVANIWYSNSTLSVFRGANLPDRILTLAGDSASNYDTPESAKKAAGKRIADVVERLSIIVNDESKTERDLLAHFKTSPESAILLNSDSVKLWREESIQDYGQIDFVIELVDGTHEVIEIESHTSQVFTEKDEVTQNVQHAVNQVERWITGANKSNNRVTTRYDVTGGECFEGSVVIGRSSAINSTRRKENWHTLKRRMKVATWDDILRRGKLLAARLDNPVIKPMNWER